MYTRVNCDGYSYVTKTRYFSPEDLEDGQTHTSGLAPNDLTIQEIQSVLESDAEGENYHGIMRTYGWIVCALQDTVSNPEEIKAFMVKLLDRGGLMS